MLLLGVCWIAGNAAAAQRAGGRGGSLNPTTHLDLLVERLNILEIQFNNLRDSVRGAPLSRSPAEVNDLLFEANFAFLTEDYERSSLLYFSLLENGDLVGHGEEAEAQYFLAESLFLARNFYPAQEAFKNIVSIGPTHPHYDGAVMKLIEICGFTGDVELFNYYYNNFLQTTRSGSGPSALRVRYALGKTLYRQGKLDEAKAMFNEFPKGSTYTSQARYHYGEILVKEGYEMALAGNTEAAEQRYRAAMPVFQDVIQLPISTDEQLKIQHLAYLALGALSFELKDLPAAIAAYQNIPNSSSFFADSLFQICWAYIQLGDYEGALRTIDIFLLAFPDDTREPELKLLAAHLRVKLKNYEDAVTEYKAVVAEYEDIKQRLDVLVGSDVDPMVYFNQLVDESYIVDVNYQVPELAARMAREDPRLAKAVGVASDLQREAMEIAEGQETVATIEAAVYAEDSGDLMTAYRAKRQEMDGLDAQILDMESDLVIVEANYLIDALGGENAAGIQQIVERRRQLSREVASVSAMYSDRAEYREDVESAAKAVDNEAYKLETMVDDILARLAGNEIYLKTQLASGAMTDGEVQGHKLAIQALRDELREHQEEFDSIHRAMATGRLTASLGDESDETEQGKRKEVRAQMAQLAEDLIGYRSGVTKGNARQFFASIDSGRQRLRNMRNDGQSMRVDLERREREELDQIRQLLSQEKSALSSYAVDAQQYRTDSTDVSGHIAEASFRGVQREFEDTVMQADMGAIDVFWMQKEEVTTQRENLRDERNAMLKELKRMYSGLLDFDEEEEDEDDDTWGVIE